MSEADEKNGKGRVRVLFNPRSGLGTGADEVRRALDGSWDRPGVDLAYQISHSVEDGVMKARAAVGDGVDVVVVIGGDGMVNSIGSALIGSGTAMAVVPTGSGNGFARHFDIPLDMRKAAKLLAEGNRRSIDVGVVNGEHPFFVTCGLAWDAELVRGFEESPTRGILPYVFSGIYHYFTYQPERFELLIDGESAVVDKPLALTVANLTQYGGGARIAPDAHGDDGLLELVAVPKLDPVEIVTQARRLFDGSISKVEGLRTWRFKRLELRREQAGSVQVDGERRDLGRELVIEVRPGAMEVIVPQGKLQ